MDGSHFKQFCNSNIVIPPIKITNYIRSNLIKHVVDGTDNHLNVPTLYKLSRRDHLFQRPRRLHTNYQICVHNDGE